MIDLPETEHQQRPMPAGGSNYRTIAATCNLHGAIGFTNLAGTKRDGGIQFTPHVAGACVITLDEPGTRALFDLLGEWLG